MSIFLEHDDVNKARRAMIVASVTIIVLEYVTLSSHVIEIFKLKIDVSLPKLIFAGKVSVAYLSFVFLWRVWVSITEDRVKFFKSNYELNLSTLKTSVDEILSKRASAISRITGSPTSAANDEIIELQSDYVTTLPKLIEDFSNFEKNKIRSRSFIIDVYVPLAISFLAITSLHQLVVPEFVTTELEETE